VMVRWIRRRKRRTVVVVVGILVEQMKWEVVVFDGGAMKRVWGILVAGHFRFFLREEVSSQWRTLVPVWEIQRYWISRYF
jgi:hypothetical protein